MPPTKLSHVVFQTDQKKEMQDWYCDVLEGRVVYEDTHLGFMTYDDEHHRVAFVDLGPLIPRHRDADMAVPPTDPPGVPGRGIRPFYSINHGPTTSLYYSDPDGNRVEFLVDNFATAEEGQAWMRSPAFESNPIGVEFDPDELVRRFRSGVPVADLVIRDA